MRYSDAQTFVTDGLTALGYGTSGHADMPLIDPGPPTVARLQAKSPGSMLFLTLGNGVGLAKEGLFDMPFLVVRVVGPQSDYATTEQIAYDLDNMLLAVGSNQTLGTAKVLYVTRTSGAPQLIDFDAGDRYHFQTTYIVEAQRV